ncbi:MAG: acyl-CoA dehydrogenase family protein [Gammaproteobacteria bacterium]|nr:acyl-CoA dehydrogenase family protein [Gammaproteobacteria bacterium]
MDFSLTDEQAMLRESVEQFVTKAYTFEQREKYSVNQHGFAPENWQQFAELGWLALPFTEDDGGFDGGPIETMLLLQEFGKGLVVEPYIASIILAGGALKRSTNKELRQKLLPSIIDGSVQAAVAFAEAGAGYNLADISTTATKTSDAYRITGDKVVVLNGAAADWLLVSTRTGSDQRDANGISLFCVAADSDGVTRRGYHTVDGMHAAEVSFADVPVRAEDLVVAEGAALPLIQTIIDDATLAVSAEAVGIMEMLNLKTVEYTKTREQFGVPLSSFQALQHRMVDMFTDFEMTRSLLLMAAIKATESSPDTARAIAALKYQIGTAGRKLGQEAVQLHGGMGVTDELDVAHYFKRLTTIDTLFGNADYQLARFTGQ